MHLETQWIPVRAVDHQLKGLDRYAALLAVCVHLLILFYLLQMWNLDTTAG